MIRVPGSPAPPFRLPGWFRSGGTGSTDQLFYYIALVPGIEGQWDGGKRGGDRAPVPLKKAPGGGDPPDNGTERQTYCPLDQAPPARSGLMDCKPWGKKARPLSGPGFSWSDVRSGLVARLFPTVLGTLRAHPYASRGYCPRSTPCGLQRRCCRGSSSTPQRSRCPPGRCRSARCRGLR
jgi:hypothetical protein